MKKLDNNNNKFPSVSKLAEPLVDALVDNAESLRISVIQMVNGTRLVDAGIEVPGGLEAGRQIAEICLGGLGTVNFRASASAQKWAWHVDVVTSNPVIGCLASQYAGWSLSHGKGKKSFNALGSGPGRAIGSNETLFNDLQYRDQADSTCVVIESDSLPPVEIADMIAEKCNIDANKLTLIITPTSSLAGGVQVVARVLETALHKVHALGFPLRKIVDGAGSAPVCPPSSDSMTAMSRTNDSILFAGQVQLYVNADDDEAGKLAKNLPSSASKDYGKPFGIIFREVGYDFYKIDPMLFSPASVAVTSLVSGNTFHEGKVDTALLDQSFSNHCA